LQVKEGGLAAKAGLQGTSRDADGRLVLGDIIEKVDGVGIETSADLYRALDKAKVDRCLTRSSCGRI
jgi:S1-C subfamily serine protease